MPVLISYVTREGCRACMTGKYVTPGLMYDRLHYCLLTYGALYRSERDGANGVRRVDNTRVDACSFRKDYSGRRIKTVFLDYLVESMWIKNPKDHNVLFLM